MSETKQQYTPIDELVALCNKHNHTPLDINHLTCNKCKKWLTKPIYLIKDGYNVCKECKTSDCIQNISLENLLEGQKHPCKYSKFGCNYFSNSIHNHEEECSTIKRCICKEILYSQSDLIAHLKNEHAMETLQLTKPVAKWQVDRTVNNFMLLEAGETKLIVCILPTETITDYRMCVYNGSNHMCVMMYAMNIVSEGIDGKIDGVVTNTFLSLNNMTAKHVPAKNSSLMNIKIYFNSYEKFEFLEAAFNSILKNYECPICYKAINDYCYQCANGHNVCINCQPKITACPICRQVIEKYKVNIKNFTNQIQRLCKFSLNGCFCFNTLTEIRKHEQICLLKLKCCDLCQIRHFDNIRFYDHLLIEHNMPILKDSPMVVVPGYLGWAGCVFKFDFKITDYNTDLRKVSWYVRLMDGPKANQFCNYTLEMVICGRSIVINGEVQNNDTMENICYPCTTEDNSPTFLLSFAFTDQKQNYKLLHMSNNSVFNSGISGMSCRKL